jgi:glycosyltransferase involved in cell wall biosynthesis
LPEVIADGVTGILCPQDDCAAFAAAARRLQQDPQLWSSMSQAAMRHARRPVFSIESMVEGYLGVYEAALAARS